MNKPNTYKHYNGNSKLAAKNGFAMELADNYFITNNIVIEGSIGYVSSKVVGTFTGKTGEADNAQVAKTAANATAETKEQASTRMHIVPMDIALQYHFMPDSSFKPYVGVGYGIEFVKIAGVKNSIKSNGLVLQIGTDVAYNDSMSFNFDVKYKPNHKIKMITNRGKLVDILSKPKLSTTTIMAGVSFPF